MLSIADTVVLALMPGSGDSVQALKAGIMEIPDVIAINKLDHPLAQTMANEVRQVLALGPRQAADRADRGALNGAGIDELWAAIEAHGASPEVARGAARREPRGGSVCRRVGAGPPSSGDCRHR